MTLQVGRADHIPEGESGNYKIVKYEVTPQDAKFHNLRCAINGRPHERIRFGIHTKLIEKNGTLWMSDTLWERNSNSFPLFEAQGNVLISGLGLGLVTKAILKIDTVKKVVVNEISEDIINLIAPYLPKDDRLTINCADAFTWNINGLKFNTVWHDIWAFYNGDTYEESKELHKKYKYNLIHPHWQGSWGRVEYLREIGRTSYSAGRG